MIGRVGASLSLRIVLQTQDYRVLPYILREADWHLEW